MLIPPSDLPELWPIAEFVALDFETTGLDPYRERIVEIGALRFDAGGLSEPFSLLVDPGMPIPFSAQRIHGISDGMVKGAPKVAEGVEALLAFMGSAIIVAHNAPFDLSFLREALARSGRVMPDNPAACTRDFARYAFPGRRSYSLQNLAAALGLDPGSAHRALDDCKVCAGILRLGVSAASGGRSRAGIA